jgi:hypothetical protein
MDAAYDKALQKRTQKAIDNCELVLQESVRLFVHVMRERTASRSGVDSSSWFTKVLETVSVGCAEGSKAAWKTGESRRPRARLSVRDAADFITSIDIAFEMTLSSMKSDPLSYEEEYE